MAETFEQAVEKIQQRAEERHSRLQKTAADIQNTFPKPRVVDSDSLPKANWGTSDRPLEPLNSKR